MILNIDKVINLTTDNDNPEPKYVDSLMIADEPDSNINQFYIKSQRAEDKNANVSFADYDNLSWSYPEKHMTTMPVHRIGIKSYPQQGAIGFFTLLHEDSSKILSPVFVEKTRYERPDFSVTVSSGTATFTMQSPTSIEYTCWRIVLRNGYDAYEYISYEDTIAIAIPSEYSEYECYCVGYVDEGQFVSDDSEHILISIGG